MLIYMQRRGEARTLIGPPVFIAPGAETVTAGAAAVGHGVGMDEPSPVEPDSADPDAAEPSS